MGGSELMAGSAAFEPVRRNSDHIVVAARANEPSADAQASRPRPAGGLLRPSQFPGPGGTTSVTGSLSPGTCFSTDFSQVPVHTDGAARAPVAEVGARAAVPRVDPQPSSLEHALRLQAKIGDRAASQLVQSLRSASPSASGLPADLRQRAEESSGLPLNDVRVHHNSPLPLRILASAFTAGSDIHLSPGGEQDLDHEVSHVIQQRLGRVSPTTSLGDLPVNADRRLEHEADAMGASLHGGAGPGIGTGTATPTPAQGAMPVLQGRWLVDPDQKIYFWEDDGTAKGLPPAQLKSFTEEKPTPKPGTYNVDTGSRRQRLVLSLETFTQTQRGSSARGPQDIYNPFGRFAPQKVSSFLPDPKLSADTRAALLESLAKKDPTFREVISGSSTRSPEGYSTEVIVEGGAKLQLVEVTPYGAVYATERPSNARAAATAIAQEPAALKLRTPQSSDVKIAWGRNIDKQTVEAWAGSKREIDQGQVMGASAGEVAQNAGFDPNEGLGWEWLHLIAHSMGGIDVHGPQVADNLVAGTSECNTQMIVVEEFLKDYVVRNKGRATLVVFADMYDPVRHIGNRITYDFYVSNERGEPVEVYHWIFDPLSRTNPIIAQNRTLRTAGRAALQGGGQAATAHIPMSQPTAHRDLTGSDPLNDLIDEVQAEFWTRGSEEFVKGLVNRRDATQSRKLPHEVFSALADWLPTRDAARQVITLVGRDYSEPAARAILESCLYDHHAPDDLRWLWDNLVVSLYGTGVPPYMRELFDRWLRISGGQPQTVAAVASSPSPDAMEF